MNLVANATACPSDWNLLMASANESAIKWPNADFSEKDVKEIDGNDDRVEKGTIKQILVFACCTTIIRMFVNTAGLARINY